MSKHGQDLIGMRPFGESENKTMRASNPKWIISYQCGELLDHKFPTSLI